MISADSRTRGASIVGIAVVIALLFAYVGGTFDRALAPLGLNWGECATNGFGATFCGDDLDDYRQQVAEPAQEAQGEIERLGREAEAEERGLRRAEEAAIIEGGGVPCVGRHWEPGCGY